VADLLGVTARSPDGVVEALELAPSERDKLPFLLAVQYHPERLSGRDKSHRALFDSFVSACAFGREESL
jgi:putative glutamine amidotransferase